MSINGPRHHGERHVPRGVVLAIHDDVALMFALAFSLNELGVDLLPARTVAEGIELLSAFSVTPEVLLIDCGAARVLSYARALRFRTPNLKVVGFRSESNPCAEYKELLSTIVDPVECSITKCAHIIGSLVEETKLGRFQPESGRG